MSGGKTPLYYLNLNFMFDSKNHFQFIQIKPSEGEQSFLSYSDLDGNTYKAIASIDQHGNKRSFVVTWSARNRIYRGAKNKKIMVEVNGEIKKMPLYDYIKNYDKVEGSPNLRGQALYKELDPIKDAKLALGRKVNVAKATNIALALEGENLSDMAAMIGEFINDPDVQKFRVVEFADQEPDKFQELHDSSDFKAKAVIRKAVHAGLAKKKGKAIEWSGELHADEADFVSALLKDPKKLEVLSKQVAKLS